MSHWTTYGLLGAVAGPVVLTIARAVTHDERLSWSAMTRCGWALLAAASGFLCTALTCVATRTPLEASTLSWFVIVGLLLALIDSTIHRLPHRISGALLVGSVVQFSFLALLRSDFDPLLRAGLAAVVVTATGLTVYVGSRQGLGFGSVGGSSWARMNSKIIRSVTPWSLSLSRSARENRTVSWDGRIRFSTASTAGIWRVSWASSSFGPAGGLDGSGSDAAAADATHATARAIGTRRSIPRTPSEKTVGQKGGRF